MIATWPAAGLPPRSLTGRIALLFATTTLCLFAATGYVLDRALWTRLEARDAAQLTGRLEHLRHVLAQPADELPNDPVGELLDAMVGSEDIALSVYDAQGTALRHTGFLLALVVDDRVLAEDEHEDSAQIVDRAVPGGFWRVLTARVSSPRSPVGYLVLGRNADQRRALQDEFRRQTVLVLAAAALATAALGALGVWTGLQPLRRVTAAASNITAERLHQRLGAPKAPTEVTQLVRAFDTMLDRLDASFEQLSRFSADLAHEFKTPLANLLLQSQVSLAQLRTPAEYQALVESNVEELERLSRMVDNMLFLARADNAQISLAVDELDARAELQRIAAYFELLADERGVGLSVQGRGRVRADAELLRRAIGNLVANAIRHAEPGTQVLLRAAPSRISVVNRGESIARDDLARLFDRFYRADPSRQDVAGATGLGLAIVRSIMGLHAGRAEVRHAAGLTTFELVFPETGAAGDVRRAG